MIKNRSYLSSITDINPIVHRIPTRLFNTFITVLTTISFEANIDGYQMHYGDAPTYMYTVWSLWQIYI